VITAPVYDRLKLSIFHARQNSVLRDGTLHHKLEFYYVSKIVTVLVRMSEKATILIKTKMSKISYKVEGSNVEFIKYNFYVII
jgi:hypothetical protein